MKIGVLGKGVVGKSSLTYLFINYNAPKEHDPTIEDQYKTQVTMDGLTYEVEILDTAGEDDYQNMMDNWISFGEGFLLVFALNDAESFKVLEKKYERIMKTKSIAKCPIVLVGNKKDLVNERKVSYTEGKELADRWNSDYYETSALTRENYKEPFMALLKKLLHTKFDSIHDPKKKKCCHCNIY